MNNELSNKAIENKDTEITPHPSAPTAPPPTATPTTPPSTIPNSPFTISTRRPRSKIARLPHDVRQLLNHSLREGLDNLEICIRLHTLGHKHITGQNITAWARTGYRQWLREKTQLETSLAQTSLILTQLSPSGQPNAPDLPLLIDTFMARLLQQLLQDFDPASLKSMLAEKPADIFRLLQSLNGHLSARAADKRAELDRARCQVEVAEKTHAGRDIPPSIRSLWDLQRRVQGTEAAQDPVTLTLQKLYDPKGSYPLPPTPETEPA